MVKGESDKVKQMLENGVDAASEDFDGRNALMLACRNGNRKLVEIFLRKKIPINKADKVFSFFLILSNFQTMFLFPQKS